MEKKPELVALKTGEIVYFSMLKRSLEPGLPNIGIRGHAFGIYLGVQKPDHGDVPLDHAMRLLLSIGLVKIDDIADVLGVSQTKKIAEALLKKYPIPKPTDKTVIQERKPALVDPTGKPLLRN